METQNYIFLRTYCSLVPIQNVLVTSSGDRYQILSCVVKGIQDNANLPSNKSNLIYLESSKTKYDQVHNKYAFFDFLKSYNCLSVHINDVSSCSDEELLPLKNFETEYILTNNIEQNGIDTHCKDVENFDLVIFNNNELMTHFEYEKLKHRSSAFVFIKSDFYKYKEVFEDIKLNGFLKINSNSNFKIFIKKELSKYMNTHINDNKEDGN